MSRRFAVLLALFSFTFVSHADSSSTQEDFCSFMLSDEQVQSVREQLVASLIAKNPEYRAYRKVFDSWFDEVFAADSMRLHARTFVDSSLTDKEMEEILSFVQSETGRKFMKFNHGISQLFENLTRQRLALYLPKLKQEIDNTRLGTLKEIETPKFSGSLVEDPAGKYNFQFSESKWKLLKKNLSRHSDYTFELLSAPCYGTIISGSSPMDSDMLKEVARNNLKRGARQIEVVEEKEIKHNGASGYYLKMEALMETSRLTYFGYYFGGQNGTVQVLCWTDRSNAHKLQPEIEQFLSGVHAFVN